MHKLSEVLVERKALDEATVLADRVRLMAEQLNLSADRTRALILLKRIAQSKANADISSTGDAHSDNLHRLVGDPIHPLPMPKQPHLTRAGSFDPTQSLEHLTLNDYCSDSEMTEALGHPPGMPSMSSAAAADHLTFEDSCGSVCTDSGPDGDSPAEVSYPHRPHLTRANSSTFTLE